MITIRISGGAGEGKTTISSILSNILMFCGKKVALDEGGEKNLEKWKPDILIITELTGD